MLSEAKKRVTLKKMTTPEKNTCSVRQKGVLH